MPRPPLTTLEVLQL